MAYSSVRLVPGINLERTPTLLEAGYSQSQLIRFKDDLAQKYGGSSKFYPSALTGIPREIHAWEDLNGTNHLGVGTTSRLNVITSGTLINITPQIKITNPSPNFSTTIGSPAVTVEDSGVTDVTTFDAILFNTPVSVGGLILSGLYPITSIVSTHIYTITASSNATANVANAGAVPLFTTGDYVNVTLQSHGRSVNDTVVFPIATTGGGTTISGLYKVKSVGGPDDFTIVTTPIPTSIAAFSMNGSAAQLVYYITLGGGAVGSGITPQTGTPITAVDWTEDNWGTLLIATPQNGGVYSFDSNAGYTTGVFNRTGPPFNGGAFVSNAQQILICWGSTVDYRIGNAGIGQIRDPLWINWSTVGDFTNFIVASTTQAGGYRIPSGALIRGGMSVANQNLIWTDLDLWAMNYIGPPFVYAFNKIGEGAGLISSHGAQGLHGSVYWMGSTNFYSYTPGGGVRSIPCPVWDAVFQNLDTANAYKVRAMPNTPFNEVGWLYPSAGGSGECDSYVKMNVVEQGTPWDYGTMGRSAWMDQSILGMPISASAGGIIYSQETTNNNDGAALSASFTTGYFMIGDGEVFAMVDQIIPDFKFGMYGASQNASIQITFNTIDYPGDTPITNGPYTFTNTTSYIAPSPRIRGRQMSMTVASSDLASFWRLGRIRYRWSQDGRR